MDKNELGYTYDQYGYMLSYRGQNIGGAGVMGKPKMHWRHTRKNIEDNREYAKNEIAKIIAGNGDKRFIDMIVAIDF